MIDLHCHSTASDGIYTPEELAVIAYEKQLTAMALTDHDTVDGVDRFFRRREEIKAVDPSQKVFRPVAGIEFSTDNVDGQKMHLLGLFIDPHNEDLLAAARQNVQWRDERNLKMLERLQQYGFDLSLEFVSGFCAGDILGRPHFAAAMMSRGYCKNHQEAFARFIGNGSPCYVNRETVPVGDCIAIIHKAGGLAVWAHPFSRASMTFSHFCVNLEQLKRLGLDGCEAYHPAHSQTQTTNVAQAVKERGMVVTGGSDSHGPRFARQFIGEGNGLLRVPDRLMELLQNKLDDLTNSLKE